MKAKITSAKLLKPYKDKYGQKYAYEIGYDGKKAIYKSKSQDQNKFITGKEAEFTEEWESGKNGDYLVVKPVYANRTARGNSTYSRALQREQSKYSGFSLSYAKDLVVAGVISVEDIFKYSNDFFNHMVDLDNSIKNTEKK